MKERIKLCNFCFFDIATGIVLPVAMFFIKNERIITWIKHMTLSQIMKM